MLRRFTTALAALALAGCTLYSDVSVSPLILNPSDIERGSDVQSMLRKADYLRAIEAAPGIESKARKNADDLGAVGAAFLAAGRYDDARTRLRAALDLKPFRNTYAQIAWNLSQVEYMSNNYESSLEWARVAKEHGLSVRDWHLSYLDSLKNTRAYVFTGAESARLGFRFGKPDVPRLTVRINGAQDVDGIIDSGAVLSIISARFASALNIRSLGEFQGTFYGLLGEPIQVRFGVLDKLEIGEISIENVPVAIMPNEKMRFLTSKREGTEFAMDFLLGSNLLKEFRLELDFDHHRATFTPLKPADRHPGPDQNIFIDGFRPYVRGAVNRKGWYLFVLDTGSEITFLNQARMNSLPIQNIYGGHSAMLQGLGGSMKRGAKVENVEVGIDRWGGKFKTLPMYSSSDKDQAVGIVGQNFLKHFNVVIDFGKMKIELGRR